jgi:hypothetical protein
MKLKTFGDLPDPTPPGTFLGCPAGCERWSATRGDYFMSYASPIPKCTQCGKKLRLLRERRTLDLV